MSPVNPQMGEAARRILDHAVRRTPASSSASVAATAAKPTRHATLLVVTEMRPHMTNLMGNAGFRGLLARALTLTEARHPWVRAAHVNADGSLVGLDALEVTVGSADFRDGSIALLAQLLALLALFVGEALAIRLMRDIWPDLSLADLESSNGDNR